MMITKRLLACFVMLIIMSPTYSSGIEQLPATLVYNLDLKIDYNTKKLYGTCEITISNITEEPIKNVPVSLDHLTYSVIPRKDGGMLETILPGILPLSGQMVLVIRLFAIRMTGI